MADEPKPANNGKPADKAPAPAPASDPFVEIVTFIVGAFVVLFLINSVIASINSSRLFSHGLAGLTPQGIIANHTRPIASLANPILARIVVLRDTSVYSDAGGRQIVGTQKFNARGKILQGPVIVAGKNYYYVDFDSGVDGWVTDTDTAYLESEPSLFELALIYIFTLISIFKIISIIVSILIIAFLVYVVRKLTEIRVNERKLFYPTVESVPDTVINPKWERIVAHVESQNENDWRLAILEADIMLAEILERLSLPGETMGEKLKAVEQSDFTTINLAWEAHKIRNQIAHEGSDFSLSQREARRVIDMYRQVFEEFQVI